MRRDRAGRARADRRAARRCGARRLPNRRARRVDLVARRVDAGQMRGGGKLGFARRSARPWRGCARGSSRRRHRSPRRSAGASGASVSIDCHSVSAIFSVLGGKNSKLTSMSPRASANKGACSRGRLGRFYAVHAAFRSLGVAGLARRATASRSARRRRDARHASSASPAASNQPSIASSAKPSRTWASRLAQFLALVRRRNRPPAGARRARAPAPPRRSRRRGDWA